MPACAMSDWSRVQLLMLSLVHVYGPTEKHVTPLGIVNAVVCSLAHTILRFGLDKASHPVDKDRKRPLVDLIFLSW